MRQPIGSKLHGVLDYVTGASLLAAAALPPLRGRLAGRMLGAAGAAHVGYSAVTDYELGLWRRLPYGAHLVLDAAGALGLVAVGASRKEPVDRGLLVGVGLYELGAVLLSRPEG